VNRGCVTIVANLIFIFEKPVRLIASLVRQQHSSDDVCTHTHTHTHGPPPQDLPREFVEALEDAPPGRGGRVSGGAAGRVRIDAAAVLRDCPGRCVNPRPDPTCGGETLVYAHVYLRLYIYIHMCVCVCVHQSRVCLSVFAREWWCEQGLS